MTTPRRRLRLLVGVAVVVLVASLAGALLLQLFSTGAHLRALGPTVVAVCLGGFGCAIVLHRPGVRLGPVLVVNGLGFAVGTLAAAALDFATVHPIPRLAAQSCFATVSLTRALVALWVLFILWFPDGRFTSRAWRRFFAVTVALCAVVAVSAWLWGPADRVFDFYRGTAVPTGAGGPFAGAWPALAEVSNLLLLLPLVALASLAGRYRTGGPVLRQQVRWLLLATALEVVTQVLGAALVAAGDGGVDTGYLVSVLTQPLPMLAATLAILRHRLWDIDLVVSRALVYGVLWAALSGLLLLPGLAAGLLVGGTGALTAVGIALVVTVLFQPARRRMEKIAERLVYRHRTRPYVLLSGFWEAVRTADLERLGPLLADAVCTGLGVEWAGVWIFLGSGGGGTLRPLGGSVRGAAAVSPTTAEELREARSLVLGGPPAAELGALWSDAPEAVVPLVANDELVGLLACGGRRGDRLGASDFELLELLARESALRLRNLRLEAQLRERLAEIEQQAAELLRSRHRLITAQDEERRRIERNLHDGVQQQLVSLAARLQRAATEGPAFLGALAAEAEEAIFSLQELGRGIYPSVLADRGLPAALRTQVARMPMAVQMEVDDALVCRRLGQEAEAALYFVALEALTNAAKHAPGASVAVWLRGDDGRVRLEVVDNGPGFGGQDSAGSGLQNMRDRIAAAGGTLTVDSQPGQGTRIEASLPATLLPGRPNGHPVAADSRR